MKIPLTFNAGSAEDSGQARIAAPPRIDFQGLAATNHGLIFYNPPAQGFWIIPWKDIDGYRTKMAGAN